ncbi:hypothetical protein DFA_05103 [Cavenderia fasciculata]|uniref:Uncharacterized protein n=1 Tax=Cavenderia fasciculata TaxID=261658 RepID=F4PNC0_CACFS|nr:uncharacterized protein DFA_05103 [Cavenderia fasciculata]EGG22973.1 hypothetical protein DFA_05103 [Cavenderia fasciculata]|eukprot:XP_004360824.1 hypothetical protein DFA_05103 [Cavenderia fasciculata]
MVFSRSYHPHLPDLFASDFDQMAILEYQLKRLHRWNIYDKDNIHHVTGLIQLLLIKSPNGTDNDKCLFPQLSYETKKHMHELLLNHFKQLRRFNNHEMELIQLMLSNHYNNDKDIYLFIIQTFNWFNVWLSKKVKYRNKDQYGSLSLIMIHGIIRMNNYDAHIRDKYLDVIYDTLDTIFRVYGDGEIFSSIIHGPIYMFLLVLKEYSFQDQRGRELKRRISNIVFNDLSKRLFSFDEWDSQIGCDFFKDYITIVFLDAHNDQYFIPPEQSNDYMDVEDWKKDNRTRVEERELLCKQIRSFSTDYHPIVLSILFEHFKKCLTQTSWKDKLIVLKLLNMFDYNNMDYKKGKECKWKTYFSFDFLKTVISETLKEDNVLVQCELVEFIRLFCYIPYYRWMVVDSIEFRDIIKEAFIYIIDQASSPHPRLIYFLIEACDPRAYGRLGRQIKEIFYTDPFWQECIVNLVLKSVQSNHKSLKALSTTIIALLDSFQKDKDILDHVIGFFNHTHQLGFKETNQLIQRILFSKQQQQYQPDQINRFVNVYLVGWIGNSASNLSIYLPLVMKRILGQPIDQDCIRSLLILYKQSHKSTNQYIQYLITPIIQLYTNTKIDNVNEKTNVAELLSLLFTRTVEYKGIHHQESTRLFQQILDTFTAPPTPSSLYPFNIIYHNIKRLCVITDIVQQIIVTRGNITTDQILQIIDLIVQTLQLIHSNDNNREHLSEIGQLIQILVSMDYQWNTIAMISSRVIDMVVDWINQNMELGHKSFHSTVELVVDFYDQINIIPPSITISPTTEKISYSEWIDRLILVETGYGHSYDVVTTKLIQLKIN